MYAIGFQVTNLSNRMREIAVELSPGVMVVLSPTVLLLFMWRWGVRFKVRHALPGIASGLVGALIFYVLFAAPEAVRELPWLLVPPDIRRLLMRHGNILAIGLMSLAAYIVGRCLRLPLDEFVHRADEEHQDGVMGPR